MSLLIVHLNESILQFLSLDHYLTAYSGAELDIGNLQSKLIAFVDLLEIVDQYLWLWTSILLVLTYQLIIADWINAEDIAAWDSRISVRCSWNHLIHS